jgi:hypothetical protein
MADKSPRKSNTKKAGMSLKEKRAAKKLKHPGSGGIGSVDALRTSKTVH